MSEPTARLRAICLALPAAVNETWGDPTFRVRQRTIATHGDKHLPLVQGTPDPAKGEGQTC